MMDGRIEVSREVESYLAANMFLYAESKARLSVQAWVSEQLVARAEVKAVSKVCRVAEHISAF